MERSRRTSQVCESLYPISSVGSVKWTDDGLALGGRHTLQMFEQRERIEGGSCCHRIKPRFVLERRGTSRVHQICGLRGDERDVS